MSGTVRLGKAAKYLGVDPEVLKAWARAGHIRYGMTPSGEIRYAPEELERVRRRMTGLDEE